MARYTVNVLYENETLNRVKNDQLPDLQIEIQDYYSAVASDLTAYSGVNVTMTKSGETTAKINAQQMNIVNASIGRYKYEFLPADVNSSGTYYMEFELVDSAGRTQTIFEQKTMTIRDSLN